MEKIDTDYKRRITLNIFKARKRDVAPLIVKFERVNRRKWDFGVKLSALSSMRGQRFKNRFREFWEVLNIENYPKIIVEVSVRKSHVLEIVRKNKTFMTSKHMFKTLLLFGILWSNLKQFHTGYQYFVSMNPGNSPKRFFCKERLELSYHGNDHKRIWVIMNFPYAP